MKKAATDPQARGFQVSDAEKTAAREQFRARLQELIAKFDTDGDGKLSPEERKAAMDAFLNRPR